MRVAIIGLGSWGVCALERLVATAIRGPGPEALDVEIHIVEPGTPGSGVYDVNQPDYLLLNNPCGQLSLYPYATPGSTPPYGLGLHDWATRQGFRWRGEAIVRDDGGDPIEPHHFLPRRLMGEYLQWFYRELVAAAPDTVSVLHHAASAVDVVERGDGETICLDDGRSLDVDHVIVTSGHTANEEEEALTPHQRQLSAYPVGAYVDSIPASATVGVAGMGLVAVDVVTALTVGRGGRYEEKPGGLVYRPSGREPTLVVYSRSGLPFTAKSVTGVDRTDVYQPVIATTEALARMVRGADGARRQVDVRAELLPLLFAEMDVRYYAQVAYQRSGLEAARAVRRALGAAWSDGDYAAGRRRIADDLGEFDAAALFFGHSPQYASSAEYEAAVHQMLEDDLREAEVPGGFSPVKAAAEVFRIFRDPMRSVVEHRGLSLDSYLDFNADIRSRINRLVAGPPALRSRQFLALMEAGVLRIPLGPAPAQGPGGGEGVAGGSPIRLTSTLLRRPEAIDVDVVIRGHLEEPRIDGSASSLLRRLYAEGRISQFRYGSVTVGSVDLTAEAHPIDINGRPQERIWMFGVLTEGVRHFTHYLPSPKSRIRAFEDLGACAAEILGASF